MNRSFPIWACMVLQLPVVSVASEAFHPEIHGALAQGYSYSSGNNYYGNSSSGSAELAEVAVNARATLTPSLLLSAQVMARRAGGAADGSMELDFAQLDYRVMERPSGTWGVRIGRLKNPYGFFNVTRDVVFSRDAITLPSSVYYDGDGLRNFFFATEGAQLYAEKDFGGNLGEFIVGYAPRYDATQEFEDVSRSDGLQGRVDAKEYRTAQWIQNWADGRFRSGLSYMHFVLDYKPDAAAEERYPVALKSDFYVLSLQWQLPRWVVTGEFRYARNVSEAAGQRRTVDSDGAYLQLRYWWSPQWSSFLRYDASYADRDDPSGRSWAAANGRSRHERYTYDFTLGLHWALSSRWSAFTELHNIDGAGNAPNRDNERTDLKPHTQAAFVMLAYRF